MSINEREIEKYKSHFLKKIDGRLKGLSQFEKNTGSGLIRRVKRLIFASDIYIPYLFRKFFKKGVDDVLSSSAEALLALFFLKNLKKNDVFYDIGANIGFYTELGANLCREAHGFEPHPQAFESLGKKIGGKEGVFLNNVALSDKDGSVFLHLSESGSLVSTINDATAAEQVFIYNGKIEVPSMTLKNYLKTHSEPTYIKIDVEGAEEMVIEGGKEFFKNSRPVIAMEVWAANRGGEISMRAVEKLRGLGYASYSLNPEGANRADGNLSERTQKKGWEAENYIFKK